MFALYCCRSWTNLIFALQLAVPQDRGKILIVSTSIIIDSVNNYFSEVRFCHDFVITHCQEIWNSTKYKIGYFQNTY